MLSATFTPDRDVSQMMVSDTSRSKYFSPLPDMAIYNGHEWAWFRTVVWKTIQSTDLTSVRPIVSVNPAICTVVRLFPAACSEPETLQQFCITNDLSGHGRILNEDWYDRLSVSSSAPFLYLSTPNVEACSSCTSSV